MPKVKSPVNAPVVIFQGKGGVVATVDDTTAAQPALVGVPRQQVLGAPTTDLVQVVDSKTGLVLGAAPTTGAVGVIAVSRIANYTVDPLTGQPNMPQDVLTKTLPTEKVVVELTAEQRNQLIPPDLLTRALPATVVIPQPTTVVVPEVQAPSPQVVIPLPSPSP